MMARHIVATVDEIAPGQRRLVSVNGREIGIFNVDGEFLPSATGAPHEGASLCKDVSSASSRPASRAPTSTAGGVS